jgi:hypothetical protein
MVVAALLCRYLRQLPQGAHMFSDGGIGIPACALKTSNETHRRNADATVLVVAALL